MRRLWKSGTCRLLLVEIGVLAYRWLPLPFVAHRPDPPLVCCFIGFGLVLQLLAAWISRWIGKHAKWWYGKEWNCFLWMVVGIVDQGVYLYEMIPALAAEGYLPVGGRVISALVAIPYFVLCTYIDKKSNACSEA